MMGNRYLEEHLNVDTISEIGEVYSVSPGNTNPRIETVGASISDNKTLSLKLGIGGTFPIIDESIIKTSSRVDYMSMLVYSYDDVNDPPFEIAPMNRYMYLVDKYMKQRQSFMLDVNSYNSQGIVMMSAPMAMRSTTSALPVWEQGIGEGVKRIYHAPSDFSPLSAGLSTFLVAKLSREKTIVSFSGDGVLSMVLDHGAITSGFTGSIEYEVTDNNKSVEDVISRKNIIISGDSIELRFYSLPENDFIEDVMFASFSDIVEVMTSESLAPIDIDGKLLLHGDNFVFNKTRKCIRVTLDTGEMYSLNPYCVSPVLGSTISTVIVFKEAFVKPSSIKYIGEQTTLYKTHIDESITAVDGKFLDRATRVITEVGSSSLTIVGESNSEEYFGQYQMDISVDEEVISFHQFGDDANVIRAVKIEDKYLYFDGASVFIKDISDLNFTEVILPTERNDDGERSAVVAGVTFTSNYDTLVGGVTKNSSFMYEMNYLISENSVESEIVGDVYPVDFYRIDYMENACEMGEYPMETGHTTSNNIYQAGEVSVVSAKEDGIIWASNSKYTDKNMIVYSYLSAFGKWSDEPFVVESFGYVSESTMLQTPEEHFLSLKLSGLTASRSSRTYCGDIKKIDPDYMVMWVKVRSINQSESFLLCENEYADEIQQHLGSSNYLYAYLDCQEPVPYASKLTYISNPFDYAMGISSMGSSLQVGDVVMNEFATGNVMEEWYRGHAGNKDVKSQNKINGFGLNMMSVQRNTEAALTVDSIIPETISLADDLWTDVFVTTIPEIGFIYNSVHDRYGDMEVLSKTQIKEQFRRGVKYQFNDFYITGSLRWDTGDSVVVAEYTLVDELDGAHNYSYSVFFPDSVAQEFATEPENEPEYDPYDIVSIYKRRSKLDELRMIPMYLANLLYSEFGFVQNILGIWDESSGVLVDDSTITMVESPIESGFQITATCNGVEPMFFVDHYITMSTYTFGVPYRVSANIRLSIIRINLLTKFSEVEMIEAEYMSDQGDKNGSARQTMLGYIKNFLESPTAADIVIEFSPDVFYPQGPWQNPHMYATHEDIIMQDKTYSIEVMPKSRIVTSLCVTSGNVVRFSHPAKRFGEVYSIVDGFVTREVLSNEKEDYRQRGSDTYAMEYVHHVGGGVNLNRSIYGDLLLYPARYSYPINNLIRELISPVREDAHAKAMDARSVFSRFDTRYVSNTIPSYYDKFLEFPTAFTCDALPEESVLIRDLSKIESLYADEIMYINGDNIVGDDGIVKVSFSNDTDMPITLTMTYDNYRWGNGTESFDINDTYLLQRDGWLLYEPQVNKRIGRNKSGVYLYGTTL